MKPRYTRKAEAIRASDIAELAVDEGYAIFQLPIGEMFKDWGFDVLANPDYAGTSRLDEWSTLALAFDQNERLAQFREVLTPKAKEAHAALLALEWELLQIARTLTKEDEARGRA
jgi:hypothetical protein